MKIQQDGFKKNLFDLLISNFYTRKVYGYAIL